MGEASQPPDSARRGRKSPFEAKAIMLPQLTIQRITLDALMEGERTNCSGYLRRVASREPKLWCSFIFFRTHVRGRSHHPPGNRSGERKVYRSHGSPPRPSLRRACSANEVPLHSVRSRVQLREGFGDAHGSPFLTFNPLIQLPGTFRAAFGVSPPSAEALPPLPRSASSRRCGLLRSSPPPPWLPSSN